MYRVPGHEWWEMSCGQMFGHLREFGLVFEDTREPGRGFKPGRVMVSWGFGKMALAFLWSRDWRE